MAGETATERARRHAMAHMLTHDIKNRLSTILGFVELLKQGKLDAKEAMAALTRIEVHAHEAVNLTISFLSADEADDVTLRIHPTDGLLNALVEEVVRFERPGARLRKVHLQVDLDPRIPSLPVDAPMMGRALGNLIDNAIHYSREGGTVEIQTLAGDGAATVTVRDHGSGIPAAALSRIFEPYSRAGEQTHRTSTGLGLYHVKAIVEGHGGSISVVEPADGGASFTVRLPYEARAGGPA